MTHTVRYHIAFGNHKTTISVDPLLSEALAIKLKETPETPEAYRAVRTWLQKNVIAHTGSRKNAAQGASNTARRLMIRAIMDNRLCRKWEDWYYEDD